MNDKEKMWFKLSERVTPEMEEAMLEKYETKDVAILTWWGHSSQPWRDDWRDDWWELCVVKKWVNEGNKNGWIG